MRITNWSFKKVKEKFVVCGLVYQSPRFPDGCYIHTSYITEIKCRLSDNELDIFTFSGSHYILKFEGMLTNSLSTLDEVISHFGLSKEIYDSYVSCAKVKDEQELATARKELIFENSLYIKTVGFIPVKAFYRGDDDDIQEVPVDLESSGIGRFTYLSIEGVFEFGFLHTHNGWKLSSWKGALANLHIYNEGYDLQIEGAETPISIKQGQSAWIGADWVRELRALCGTDDEICYK